MKHKKAILITGGAGFIGSNIAEKLLRQGEQVVVLDNLSTGRRDNIRDFLSNKNFKFIKGDLKSIKDVGKAMTGVDFIFHQAAIPSVARSISDPKATFDANVSGTLNLLNIAKKHKIKKIVFASSSSIYGIGLIPKKENMPSNPISPYALSKFTAEKLCQIFSKVYGLPTVCLRYFNVFGPKQNPYSEYAAVIPKFILSLLKNDKPIIFGDGKQTRDFTYIENVVEANLRALDSKFVNGEVFNIACGRQISLLDTLEYLNKIFSKNIKPNFKKSRIGDIKYSFADITQAKNKLGYTPKISFEEGLEKTCQWFGLN